MSFVAPIQNVFTALPFTSDGGQPNIGGQSSGIDPLLDKVLDLGSGLLDRVQDRRDLRLASQIAAAQSGQSAEILALMARQNAAAGTVSPVASGGLVAPGSNLTPLLLIGVGAVVLVLALRK